MMIPHYRKGFLFEIATNVSMDRIPPTEEDKRMNRDIPNNGLFILNRILLYFILFFLLVAIIVIIQVVFDASIDGTAIRLGPLLLKREFSLGESLTALSLLASAYIFIVTWFDNERQKSIVEANKYREERDAFERNRDAEREAREREYADKIRSAAAVTIAKLNRWEEINLHYIDRSSIIFEEANSLFYQGKSDEAKDELWKGIVGYHTVVFQEIVNEQIEIGYKDLYGYEPRVEQLFASTLESLRYIDRRIYRLFQIVSQWAFSNAEPNLDRGNRNELGNELRNSASMVRMLYKDLMHCTIAPFQHLMKDLIRQTDAEIFRKQNIKMAISLRNEGFDDGHQYTLMGLNFYLYENYIESLDCFNMAARWLPGLPGPLAGKALAHKALAYKYKHDQEKQSEYRKNRDEAKLVMDKAMDIMLSPLDS
jgi:hypothetical protein